MNDIRALYFFGRPFGPVYGRIMQIRSWLYEKHIFPSYALPVPVISVGNLTMGGTGKTPTVRMIAEFLIQSGQRPAVVSRGYGGAATKPVNVVSDGRQILLDAFKAGDEPFMLAASVSGLIVVTGRKRILPCRYACEELGCDVILLDDGFQHLAVQRDVDIVLFNATTLAGNDRIFPAGELREPFSALRRADLLLLTGVSPSNRHTALAFAERLRQSDACQAPVFTAENHMLGIFDVSGKNIDHSCPHTHFYAFSGIAHPERFANSLSDFRLQITGYSQFSDHAEYNRTIFASLVEKAMKSGATALVTTQKDWGKVKDFDENFPIFYLGFDIKPQDGFMHHLREKLKCL